MALVGISTSRYGTKVTENCGFLYALRTGAASALFRVRRRMRAFQEGNTPEGALRQEMLERLYRWYEKNGCGAIFYEVATNARTEHSGIIHACLQVTTDTEYKLERITMPAKPKQTCRLAVIAGQHTPSVCTCNVIAVHVPQEVGAEDFARRWHSGYYG